MCECVSACVCECVNVYVFVCAWADWHGAEQAVVQACQFHPAAPALLVGGLDKSLKIFHVSHESRVFD